MELIKATASELVARVPGPCTHNQALSRIDAVREVALEWMITEGPKDSITAPRRASNIAGMCRHIRSIRWLIVPSAATE